MELIKKQIHMNRWKGNAVTQITLDEDFIVPDTLEDMEQVILEQAHIQGENVKTQEEKITVKGKLEFQVLYRKENGGLETLGGNIPFEETVNVPGLGRRRSYRFKLDPGRHENGYDQFQEAGGKSCDHGGDPYRGRNIPDGSFGPEGDGNSRKFFKSDRRNAPGSENGKYFSCYTGSSP